MKSKNIGQKLELNKKTIANLECTEMKKIHGGGSGIECNVITTTITNDTCFVFICGI